MGLADPTGKLHLLGAGWSMTQLLPTGGTPDSAVAMFIEVPWDLCNRELRLNLELLDQDLNPVVVQTPAGPSAIRVSQPIVVNSIPGAPNGSDGEAAIIVQLRGGLPLAAATWYKWRASIDGHEEHIGEAKFFVQRQPSAPTFGGTPGQ
jgi:hypothetical protein